MSLPSRAAVRFYHKRSTCEPWMKEGTQTVKMSRLTRDSANAGVALIGLALVGLLLDVHHERQPDGMVLVRGSGLSGPDTLSLENTNQA